MKIKATAVLILLIASLGCKKSDSVKDEVNLPQDNLQNSSGSWMVDFSDYPAGEETFYELGSSNSKLPSPLDSTVMGLKVTGNNHSDDLFMFIKKRVTGLKPNHEYKVKIEVELASNAAENGIGIGGAPGESVYLKAGLVPIEPMKTLQAGQRNYVLNLDKGNQASAGKDLHNIGNIENGLDAYQYVLIKRSAEFTGKTDDKGEGWFVIGTDSGFEGTTALYYTNVMVNLVE
jgi:hypothetical protein